MYKLGKSRHNYPLQFHAQFFNFGRTPGKVIEVYHGVVRRAGPLPAEPVYDTPTETEAHWLPSGEGLEPFDHGIGGTDIHAVESGEFNYYVMGYVKYFLVLEGDEKIHETRFCFRFYIQRYKGQPSSGFYRDPDLPSSYNMET